MNRCPTPSCRPARRRVTLTGLAAISALMLVTVARAQLAEPQSRAFPASALRGTLIVTAAPDVLIDRRPARLSPGARIRDDRNMLVMSGALSGREFIVNYTREAHGLIHDVWILTPAEIALKRPGATPERNFLFGFEADAPKRDDGKTPYDQLPGLGNASAR